MSKSNKLIEDEFFVIDSNNLNNINQKLYGYIIQDETIIFDNEVYGNNLNENGSYIYIDVNDTEIKISQDFNGCYGLYLYKSEDYFAISNSFLKLVEYLKNIKPISLNKDYANSFLFADLYSFSYEETLINEIKTLSRNQKVIIDKKNKTIDFKKIDYKEHTIDLDSKEGFETLDKWFYKWTNIIRNIKSKTNNLSIHLAGGLDTRIILALVLSSNIGLDKINVFSYTDDKHTHKEDYIIASEIAEKFNFELNKSVFSGDIDKFTDVNTSLDISFYPKLGFHKQMYFKYFKFSEPVYSITGSGGDFIKEMENMYYKPRNEFLKLIKNRFNQSSDITSSVEKIAKSSLDKLSDNYPNVDSDDLPSILYRETMARNHYGKINVESYLRNMVSLTPLIDSDLYKLKLTTPKCKDKNLLMTIIFSRYCPELLDLPFEGNKKIDEKTIEYAKELNEKYEFIKCENEFISGPQIKNPIEYDESLKSNKADELLKKTFNSNSFEMEFKKYYPSTLYYKILELTERISYYPLTHIYSAIGIFKIINLVKFNELEFNKIKNYNNLEWIENNFLKDEIDEKNNFLNISAQKLLKNYNTCRIDIKNYGNSKNSIDIISNSENTKINFPNWLKDKSGTGITIQSDFNYIDLKIKCINDGILNINLRSIDIRDKKDKRFPIYIDYTTLIINSKEYITENKLTWHDEPYIIKKDVKNNELITIHVEWQPFSSSSLYENMKSKNLEEKVKKLTDNNNKQKEKIEEQENEINELKTKNEKLNNKLKEISNSSLREFRKMKKEL